MNTRDIANLRIQLCRLGKSDEVSVFSAEHGKIEREAFVCSGGL